jgi:GT2 family glycosyltransferase/glycosyltransferase involved in cell wall biosynthesis
MNDAPAPRPVQLHVIHDLGGGSFKWLGDYLGADGERTNLVLRSFAHDTAAGAGISLHEGAAPDAPAIRLWKWTQKIAGAEVSHREYREALEAILREFSVDGIVVSSLIGHSLEVLDTGLPTLVVNHDYFPYCPSINLYFGSICAHCDRHRIADCESGNPRFNAFAGFLPEQRHAVREKFVELIHRPATTMVVPSASVAENLKRLDARFHDVRFVTINHGYANPLPRVADADPGEGRLRVVILGQLSVAKGVEILREAVPRITAIADLYLVGTRELGEEFRMRDHVHVIADYDHESLPHHIAAIRPHLGLLMSIVPETFSYALSELMMLGVPVAATRLGSFTERIRHGQNGYLYDPVAESLLSLLRHVDGHREELAEIRANISRWHPRSAREMVDDYHRTLPLRARRDEPASPRTVTPTPTLVAPEVAAQALAVASMWKELKAVQRQVGILNEARDRWHKERTQHAQEKDALERRIAAANRQWVEMDAQLDVRQAEIHRLVQHKEALEREIRELRASTSWRVSAPVRAVGIVVRYVRILTQSIVAMLRQPAKLRRNLHKVATAWKAGGIPGLKAALRAMQPATGAPTAWDLYQRNFGREVAPRIVEEIKSMSRKPRVSILVPTYNTPADSLEAMLESVETQLYPEWELCVADDGSTASHVAQILKAHAARDPRIKVDFAAANGGVSRASNRALAMATGEFVVLLDHDDMLEEQALFRVAQSVVADDPDFVYSDEVHVTSDGSAAQQFVFRPAFSPEYLRGHPYIIHLVAFRTELLRELGGFDETLRISQDYDLILRATEKARRVVHIPEILYRWRIHEESTGHTRMHEVTEISREVLQRHLDRSGLRATAEAGPIYNVYETKYELVTQPHVAIIIPTRNHGDILRQCIESIRETVKRVRYDIVVVNHDSDEPATLEYLRGLDASIRVLPYSGPFNFSAINNWAVAQLPQGYTHYLLCNNDIEAIEPGWLERMVEVAQQPDVGIVGARLLYPGRKNIQHAGVLVGAYGAAEHYGKFMYIKPEGRLEPGYGCNLVVTHELSAVTAACLLIKREVFAAVRGFEEAMAVGFGDVDLCLRVRARGYRVLLCAQATLVHHESYTRGASQIDPHPQDTAEFRRRWSAFLKAGDPFYNPGLSTNSTGWDIRDPLPYGFELVRRVYDRDARREADAQARETIRLRVVA